MKNILLASVIIFLGSCASPGLSVLSSLKSVSPKKAVIVSRVLSSPQFTKSGKVLAPGERKSNIAEVSVGFTKCPVEGRKKDSLFSKGFVDKCDFSIKNVRLGEFFALEIDPTDKLSWVRVFTYVQRKSPFMGSFSGKAATRAKVENSGTLSSWFDDLIGEIGTVEAGKVYYLGSIKMELSDKSYLEIGDEEYDRKEFTYLVPKSLNFVHESSEVTAWLKDRLGYTGKLHSVKVSPKKGPFESFYKRYYEN